MNRALLLSSIAAFGACSSDESEPPLVKSDLARNMSPDTAGMNALVEGNTKFATDLYKLAAADTGAGNLFMSPHSISTALAMTYAGAGGATATQIADVFSFAASVHVAQNALDLELESRGASSSSNAIPFKLVTANSLWGQTGEEFQSPFLDTLAVNYGAGLHVLDFMVDPEGSRQVINGWVADKTNDKIKDLIPVGKLDDRTKFVLTNAVYFTAAWASPFEPSATSDRTFKLGGGSQVSVPTLAQSIEGAGYGEGEGWKAAELYYDGFKLSMVVVVPDDLPAFETMLSPAVLGQVTESLQARTLDVQLPKFKFASPLGLTEHLKRLGMPDAFDAGVADFSNLVTNPAHTYFIHDVLHEGFVAVDERGTESAAATAVIGGDDSVGPDPATLHADRPFVFFIRDLETKEILFLGRVVDPRS